jgi:hypothetical protein
LQGEGDSHISLPLLKWLLLPCQSSQTFPALSFLPSISSSDCDCNDTELGTAGFTLGFLRCCKRHSAPLEEEKGAREEGRQPCHKGCPGPPCNLLPQCHSLVALLPQAKAEPQLLLICTKSSQISIAVTKSGPVLQN